MAALPAGVPSKDPDSYAKGDVSLSQRWASLMQFTNLDPDASGKTAKLPISRTFRQMPRAYFQFIHAT